MVVDASGGPRTGSDLAARGLCREEVVRTDLAARVFGLIDAIWLGDARIAEVTGA